MSIGKVEIPRRLLHFIQFSQMYTNFKFRRKLFWLINLFFGGGEVPVAHFLVRLPPIGLVTLAFIGRHPSSINKFSSRSLEGTDSFPDDILTGCLRQVDMY